MQFERGKVFVVDMTNNSGAEANGARPVVVVSNDMSNRFSSVITAVIITSDTITTPIPCFIKLPEDEIGNAKDFYILCNHVYTIDKLKIKSDVGKLSDERMKEVDEALRSHFAL